MCLIQLNYHWIGKSVLCFNFIVIILYTFKTKRNQTILALTKICFIDSKRTFSFVYNYDYKKKNIIQNTYKTKI